MILKHDIESYHLHTVYIHRPAYYANDENTAYYANNENTISVKWEYDSKPHSIYIYTI